MQLPYLICRSNSWFVVVHKTQYQTKPSALENTRIGKKKSNDFIELFDKSFIWKKTNHYIFFCSFIYNFIKKGFSFQFVRDKVMKKIVFFSKPETLPWFENEYTIFFSLSLITWDWYIFPNQSHSNQRI